MRLIVIEMCVKFANRSLVSEYFHLHEAYINSMVLWNLRCHGRFLRLTPRLKMYVECVRGKDRTIDTILRRLRAVFRH